MTKDINVFKREKGGIEMQEADNEIKLSREQLIQTFKEAKQNNQCVCVEVTIPRTR